MTRFIADTMLGKLALWMRIMGFDVEYHNDIEDEALIERALVEDRLLLTRDTLLVRRRRLRGRVVFIESDHLEDQLLQVVSLFGYPEGGFLKRCLRCNTLLEDIDREAVKGKVPPYVYTTQKRFSRCPSCGRIYWAGTHREKMARRLKAILGKDLL